MERKVDGQRMAQMAREIRENVSRAKGYLRRDDLDRAIGCAKDALMQKGKAGTLGHGRSEVDLMFGELCEEINRHPRVVALLESLGVRGGTLLRYGAGQETLLIKKLTALQIKMEDIAKKEVQRVEAKRTAQKIEWLKAGQTLLREKNFPKGKVYLRRVVETFGDEPGLAREVGNMFIEAGLLTEAVEMFVVAIEKAPNDGEAWRLAINTYDTMGEFQKAEGLYLDAIRVFGAHPMTYLNIAKFYYKWHKRDNAYEYAERALSLDPNLAEAIELRDKTA
jgi:Flp pilus assembly protein TadD, contains TPR repeats